MYNLFKNTLRSLRNNKFTIIVLTFLLFISLSVFTTLKNTSSNINNTYQTISKSSNLHDFTVNENYAQVDQPFKLLDGSGEPQSHLYSSDEYSNQFNGTSSDGFSVP
jgi:hypothetical protein